MRGGPLWGPVGWEDLAPHCGLSMGPDGMATAAEGSGLPPWSLKGGFAGEGSTLGARSLALRSQLPGVIWGRLSQDLGWSVVTASLLLASGFPRVFLGASFLGAAFAQVHGHVCVCVCVAGGVSGELGEWE